MEIRDIEKIERVKGVASVVKSDDLIPFYTERVEKFLTDNRSAYGDNWVKGSANNLYCFYGKNSEGDLLGSSTNMGVAIATFCPEIPLITGQQLLGLYIQAGNKNPFGNVYVDFGVQINGSPNVNSAKAKILLEDFKKRGIEVKEGRVLNFNQLRLIADSNAGLAYMLTEDVSKDNLALVSEYPFRDVGVNGLYGVYLNLDCSLFAGGVNLVDSSGDGRVVRYDAEGVAPKKLACPESNLIKSLTNNFLKKF
jgi:hypothetical protein